MARPAPFTYMIRGFEASGALARPAAIMEYGFVLGIVRRPGVTSRFQGVWYGLVLLSIRCPGTSGCVHSVWCRLLLGSNGIPAGAREYFPDISIEGALVRPGAFTVYGMVLESVMSPGATSRVHDV